MSLAPLLTIALMSFVLLAPTLMVAVLVSGLSRRAGDAPSTPDAVEVGS